MPEYRLTIWRHLDGWVCVCTYWPVEDDADESEQDLFSWKVNHDKPADLLHMLEGLLEEVAAVAH